MFATHDPRLIEIIGERARWYDENRSFEYQMLYGIRPDEQRRLGHCAFMCRTVSSGTDISCGDLRNGLPT